MAIEGWVINILKIVFVIIAGHIAITKVVPLLNDFLESFIKNSKAIDSFTSLIDIFILVLIGTKIVEFLLATENTVISFISVLEPAFEIFMSLFTYLQWIILALIVVVAIKNIK